MKSVKTLSLSGKMSTLGDKTKLKDYLYISIFSFSIMGYPLISIIPIVQQTDSRPISIVYRIFFLVLVLLFAYLNLINPKGFITNNNSFLKLILIMWFFYLLRFLHDWATKPELLRLPAEEYLFSILGISVIPFFSFFYLPSLKTLQKTLVTVCYASVLTVLLLLITALKFDATFDETERLGSATLNPISFGHLAVSTCILLLTFLIFKRKNFFEKIFFTLFLIICSLVVILANSRGPLLAFAATLPFFTIYILKGKKKAKYIFAILILLISLVCVYFVFNTDLSKIGKLNMRFNLSDESAKLRAVAFQNAFYEFLDNPVAGNAFVETESEFYPHNIILECLMSTGIIGGTVLFLLLKKTFKNIGLLLKGHYSGKCIALLTIQFFISDMFSGSVYAGNPNFWYFMILCSTLVKSKEIKNFANRE